MGTGRHLRVVSPVEATREDMASPTRPRSSGVLSNAAVSSPVSTKPHRAVKSESARAISGL